MISPRGSERDLRAQLKIASRILSLPGTGFKPPSPKLSGVRSRSPEIVLFCAHRWEAEPFVDMLQLKQSVRSRFATVYHDEEGRFELYLTGQGPQRAAAVVGAALATLAPDQARVVGNFGTAGCWEGDHEIGRPYLIHRVRDAASARSFYPDRLVRTKWPEAGCTTIHTVGQTLETNGALVDMELSGLTTAAELFVSSAQIVAGKVVSDYLGESPPDWQEMVKAITAPYRQACTEFLEILENQRSSLLENSRTAAGRSADTHVREAMTVFTPLFTVTQCRQLESVLKAIALGSTDDWKPALERAEHLLGQAPFESKKERAAVFESLVQTLQASNLFSVREGAE